MAASDGGDSISMSCHLAELPRAHAILRMAIGDLTFCPFRIPGRPRGYNSPRRSTSQKTVNLSGSLRDSGPTENSHMRGLRSSLSMVSPHKSLAEPVDSLHMTA